MKKNIVLIFVMLFVLGINFVNAKNYYDSTIVVKFRENSNYYNSWQLNNRNGEISHLTKHIGKHSSSAFITNDLLTLINKKYNSNSLFINSNYNNYGLNRIAVIKLNSDFNPLIIAKKISKLNGIEYAEPMFIHKIDFKPNDTAYYMQHYIWQTFTHKAWDIMDTTGKPTVIAIVDTGIWYLHPDLEQNIWINQGEYGIDELGNEKNKNGIDGILAVRIIKQVKIMTHNPDIHMVLIVRE